MIKPLLGRNFWKSTENAKWVKYLLFANNIITTENLKSESKVGPYNQSPLKSASVAPKQL